MKKTCTGSYNDNDGLNMDCFLVLSGLTEIGSNPQSGSDNALFSQIKEGVHTY